MPVLLLSAVITVSTENELENVKTLFAGDTVLIKSGYYSDVTFSFSGNGTESEPVVVMAEKPGKVILNGLSTLDFSGEYIEIQGLFFVNGYSRSGKSVIEFRRSGIRANNSRLTQCAILNYNPSSKDIDYKWVSIYGKNNRVDHCHFEGKIHSGTTVVVWIPTDQDKPNYHKIDHNYFGPRPDLGFNGGETIRIGTSDYSLTNSHTLVEWNLFYKCDGEIEIISNKSCENIFRHNTFLESKGSLTLRHGNRCRVEGNFFFGNFLNDAGGIRIIGEDHIVVNNYLQDIYGSDYRSAICIVKGVENSPLNRYFQVKRAIIANNTIVNAKYPITMGYGSSDDQTLPPDSCVIINNAIDAGASNTVLRIGDSEGTPERFVWDGNIFYGKTLGINDPGGITWADPLLELSPDGLFRPSAESPLIGAAVSGHFIPEDDMDGHSRSIPFDVGADEFSEEVPLYKPVTRDDVGPDWPVEIEYITEVEEGENTLTDALVRIAPGDTLKLISPGGIYRLTHAVDIDMDVTFLSAFEGDERPVIRCDSDTLIFRLKNRAKLNLKNLILDGFSQSGNKKSLIGTGVYSSGTQSIRMVANGCLFLCSGIKPESLSALKINRFVKADSLVVNNCEFTGFTAPVLNLNDAAENSGDFRFSLLSVKNSTFRENTNSAISVYGGDNNPFTLGPQVVVDRCTFYKQGTDGSITLDLRETDAASVHNSILADCSIDTFSISLYGWGYMDYSNMYNSGSPSLNRGANMSTGILYVNPEFEDPDNGNFTLAPGHILLTAANDGGALGDPRWTQNISSLPDSPVLPLSIQLDTYPNPANASIIVFYSVEPGTPAELSIYNLKGSLCKAVNLRNGEGRITVDLNDLHSGVWLFRLTNGNVSITRKIVVLK